MTLACVAHGGVNLAQGVCDLPTPEIALAAAEKAMRDGRNTYTPTEGLLDLRRAIAEHQRRFHGVEVDPASQVIAGLGATGVFYDAVATLFDPGDGVLVFEPYYGYHVSTLEALGVRPVFARLEAPDFSISTELLETVDARGLRGLVLNSPGNPSGRVFSGGELDLLLDFAKEHDLWVLTDEIYEHFVFAGWHIPFASLPGAAERSVTISGASKTFSVTGWRIGWAIAPPEVAARMLHVNDLVYVCPPTPLQLGVAAALDGLADDYFTARLDELGRCRERLTATLAAVDLKPTVPAGAYYVLADISRIPGADSRERAMRLLAQVGVACVPGRAFYHDDAGERFGRFSFGKRLVDVESACERLIRLG